MPANRPVLIIFIKNPEKGKVKTRLAASVGEDRALAIYKSLLDHTRKCALAVPADRLLFYSQTIAEQDNWSSANFQKRLQHSGDLGDRITAAFQQGFSVGNKVMIIGSDCPQLSGDLIAEAFQALDKHDFVIGPALDGGYYLLGMNHFTPEVFADIVWSTDQVAAQTRIKMQAAGGTIFELPALSDVDYAEDWQKYGWEL